MKMPKDKKQRMQILAIAGIVAIGGIYAAVQFLIVPVIKAHGNRATKIAELRENIKGAQEEIIRRAGE